MVVDVQVQTVLVVITYQYGITFFSNGDAFSWFRNINFSNGTSSETSTGVLF